MRTKKIQKITILALLVAVNFLGTSLFRVYGLAPMQSITNIVGAVLLGPGPTFFIALITSFSRIALGFGSLIAIPGAIVGAYLAGLLHKYFYPSIWMAIIGEIIGTGLLGALLAAPLAIVEGNASAYLGLMFVPSFSLAAFIGSIMAYLILSALKNTKFYHQTQNLFDRKD